MDGTTLGQETLDSSELNVVTPLFGEMAFEALLTDVTGETLTAILTFTTLSEYEGFMIECDTVGNSVNLTIAIPGIDW